MATTLAPARIRVRHVDRRLAVLGILVMWVVLWALFRNQDTLPLGQQDTTPLHGHINDANDWVGLHRDSNPFFVYVLNPVRVVIDHLATFFQHIISQPAFDRPVPLIGWLGVVAVITYASWAFGNARVAVLAGGAFVFMGLQGLWQESMDTLALVVAAVFVSLLIGIPLGIWAGTSNRFNMLATPVLDFMQVMPTFVYLAPLTLIFLIGPASAVIATAIYAIPPTIRLTSHGIRSVPRTTLEATDSLGSTRSQTLTKVLLPMAKRTIVLGINQTTMAALAMVTIAALIDAPGLGAVVIQALQILDVGTAFNAGLAIVIMAIVLDRVTTAASERVESQRRSRGTFAVRYRRPLLLGGGVVTAVCVYLSYTYVWAADFPTGVDVGSPIIKATNTAKDWVETNLSGVTTGIKNFVTYTLLNPLQSLLTESPWWLVTLVVVLLALVIGDRRAAATAAACLLLIVGAGVWADAMATLAMTFVATVLVMIFGVVFGVWMGRSSRVDAAVRPVLDAGQTMPPFVYLIPVLALFGATRFTAIVAALVYAIPVAVKIVADGIRGVPKETVEAATSSGSSTWQIITKVQLPMSRRALTLATNQGLIYVLSMVVIGGLVGAGALGYDVVAGLSQGELFGKGLAAGVAIVLLGITLDRISQATARRSASPSGGGRR